MNILLWTFLFCLAINIAINSRDNDIAMVYLKPTYDDMFYNFDKFFSMSYKFALIFQ